MGRGGRRLKYAAMQHGNQGPFCAAHNFPVACFSSRKAGRSLRRYALGLAFPQRLFTLDKESISDCIVSLQAAALAAL
jgi:hypothetical protein